MLEVTHVSQEDPHRRLNQPAEKQTRADSTCLHGGCIVTNGPVCRRQDSFKRHKKGDGINNNTETAQYDASNIKNRRRRRSRWRIQAEPFEL